ncbi:MAG: DNA translocase FtsK 4TM domain-containing protein, partial [Desulfovibrionaceae bacterium]|nr:DNA translocase FtsK 4TM domain-containing protein [Desulfovibrionaceae bacterium]
MRMASHTRENQAKAVPISAHLAGLFCCCAALMLLLSLLSFDLRDPNINHVVHGHKEYYNWMGMVGAYTAGLLADFFGLAAYTLVIFPAALGIGLLRKKVWAWWRWAAIPFLGCSLATAGAAWGLGIIQVRSGGLLGHSLLDLSIRYFSRTGTALIWGFIFLIAVQSLGGFTWIQAFMALAGKIKEQMLEAGRQDQTPAGAGKREPMIRVSTKFMPLPPQRAGILSRLRDLLRPLTVNSPEPREEAYYADSPGFADASDPAAAVSSAVAEDFSPERTVFERGAALEESGQDSVSPFFSGPEARLAAPLPVLPPLSLLRCEEKGGEETRNEELEARGKALLRCLNDFSVQADLARITPGPVVTTFEVRPAPGVKAARISGLSDDLARGLKAVTVRIQAPIPGTDAVGIEIPNDRREMVYLSELISSADFQEAESPLTLGLGKDSSGSPIMADLAKMPHLLVAGATGTGKSVFLNSLLLSMLYRTKPEEVKFLLIDPKRVEMAVYEDLPHLVHPIVKDMPLVKNALEWVTREMDGRYDQMALLNVRDFASYNAKLGSLGEARPPHLAELRPFPYLVLIIDELADLMLTSGKEVETCLVRLAQLARAAGIHLIVATQRPSVDVVTGLIKANFPCRVSFQVASKHDSRTILDTVGAEHLLGQGDMLYKPAGGRFQRLHGAYVSAAEVEAVSNFWRARQKPDYQVDFASLEQGGEEDSVAPSGDELYPEAVQFVREQGRATISFIQRRFNIGFNRAARLIEQMEKDGIVS